MVRRINRHGGRVPYSFVALVVLSSIFTLSVYLEQVVVVTTAQSSFDVPGQTQSALDQAEAEVSAVAQQDLMQSEVGLLSAGINPQLNLLNQSLNTAFTASMTTLGLSTPQGLSIGNVVIRAESWGINATFTEGVVQDSVPQATTQAALGNPTLPLASTANTANVTRYATTEEPVYPMAVGQVTLTALDGSSGERVSVPYGFSVSVQSELGLLEAQTSEFTDSSWGPSGGLAKLDQYILTTLGELRALSGYGSGGYPGYQASTVISGPAGSSILSASDVHDAESLAVLLQSLRYFRSFDAGAVSSLLSSLSPGPYQQLLDRYVFNGTIDPATLFLLFLDGQGGWSDGWIASGEGLAGAIYSFADRFKFDLLQQFWRNQTVDPTLNEPVASWPTIVAQGNTYAMNMLFEWLWDYGTWLGVTQQSLPAYDNTVNIAPMVGTSGGCTYVLFPGGTIETSDPGVPNLASLILGSPQEETIQLPGPTPGSLVPYNDYLAPDNFQIWENVSIDQPSAPYYVPANYWIDFNENATYITTHDSLLLEFNPTDTRTYDPGAIDRTLHAILVDTSDSIQHKSATAAQVANKGYLDYVALQGDQVGGNSTLGGAGLPNLATTAGRNTALNTSYSFLTNGTSSLFQGPFSSGLTNFSTSVGNPVNVSNWWVNGASHPTLAGSGNPTSTLNGGTNWTMSAISSYAASEWFQMLYTLWYGSGGTIPVNPPPVADINYNNMDASQYNVLTPGVEQNPPAPYREPNFAVNVMNETFVSIYCWITGLGTGIGCGGEAYNYEGNFCPNTFRFFQTCLAGTANNNGNYYFGAGCGFGNNANQAYQNAMTNYYDVGTGGLANMWHVVRTAVSQSLQGGIDQIHQLLQSSWDNVYNNTGDANWAGQNFTNWILKYIAPPVLNDTVAMGTTGGWVTGLYQSTERWLQEGNNLTGTVVQPWIDRGRPYSFTIGNASLETADGQVFQESLSNMTLAFSGGTFAWSVPDFTVHLVDPQNDSSNMGIAPFETSWSVTLQGTMGLSLTSSRESLFSGGVLRPTVLNVSVPVNSTTLVTIYTPWPLSSGWDPGPNPLPGDPALLETRLLLGLEGHDYHGFPNGPPTNNLLPGVYPSLPLDNLVMETAAVGRVTTSEGNLLANLLAGLPAFADGRSAQWSQNLTTLETTTNADLSSTGGTFLAAAQQNFETIAADLGAAAQGGVPGTFNLWGNGFLGYNATVDTDVDTWSYYSPLPSGALYNPPQEYDLAFQGARVGDTFSIDNPYTGVNPGTNGFNGSWGTSNLGQHQLQADWNEFGHRYSLNLIGPMSPTPSSGGARAYPDLAVPYVFGIRGNGYPATLSVGDGSGPLPAAALTAFANSLPPAGAPVSFPEYRAQQTYAAGRFYDALVAGNVPRQAGVNNFGYSTNLSLGPETTANYTLALVNDSGGLFATNASFALLESFLRWFDDNAESLAYSLGAPTLYLTVLSTIPAALLAPTYRTVSLTWNGGATSSLMYAWGGLNMAGLEADLGGAGGGMGNSPTFDVGGGTTGGWGFSGTLTG